MPRLQTLPVQQAELSSDPASPTSGYSVIYPLTNGKWYAKNSAGGVTEITNIGLAAPTVNTYTASQTLSANTINIFNLAGNATATLPSAGGIAGQRVTVIWNSGNFVLTQATTSSQNINGVAASNIKFRRISQSHTYESDGSNWFIT